MSKGISIGVYKLKNTVYTIYRGEYMKKAIGMMALGAGFGAGMMYVVDKYRNGDLSKSVDKGAKEITKAVNKIKN